jgi:hypothetical protein
MPSNSALPIIYEGAERAASLETKGHHNWLGSRGSDAMTL